MTVGVSIHLIFRGRTWISRAATIARVTIAMENRALDQTREKAMVILIYSAICCRTDMRES
jgi:hypothetical protein